MVIERNRISKPVPHLSDSEAEPFFCAPMVAMMSRWVWDQGNVPSASPLDIGIRYRAVMLLTPGCNPPLRVMHLLHQPTVVDASRRLFPMEISRISRGGFHIGSIQQRLSSIPQRLTPEWILVRSLTLSGPTLCFYHGAHAALIQEQLLCLDGKIDCFGDNCLPVRCSPWR